MTQEGTSLSKATQEIPSRNTLTGLGQACEVAFTVLKHCESGFSYHDGEFYLNQHSFPEVTESNGRNTSMERGLVDLGKCL